MPRPPRAFLFDFDGVIVDSELLHFHAFQRAAKDVGLKLTETDYFEELLGRDDRGCWREIARRNNVTLKPAQLLELCTYKARLTRDIILERKYKPLPGVEQTVRGLYRHYPLAIVSGALREEIELMLDGIGLRDCFKHITAAEDVTRGKPDPMGYLQTLAAISNGSKRPITPAQCVIFEDAPRVITATRQKKFRVIGVASSHAPEKLTAAGATAVVTAMTPDQVRSALPGVKFFEA